MFRLFKQEFTGVLSFSDSLATKCKYLNNQPCATRPTLINLDPDEHNQAYHG